MYIIFVRNTFCQCKKEFLKCVLNQSYWVNVLWNREMNININPSVFYTCPSVWVAFSWSQRSCPEHSVSKGLTNVGKHQYLVLQFKSCDSYSSKQNLISWCLCLQWADLCFSRAAWPLFNAEMLLTKIIIRCLSKLFDAAFITCVCCIIIEG